jgi:hypothetical protein
MTTSLDAVPDNLKTDLDVYEVSLCAPVDNFQARFAEAREQGPVLYSPHYGGYWLVVQYKEAAEVLRDPERFSSYPNNVVPHGFGKFIPLEYDPPIHTAMRAGLQPLFNPKRMTAHTVASARTWRVSNCGSRSRSGWPGFPISHPIRPGRRRATAPRCGVSTSSGSSSLRKRRLARHYGPALW